MSSDTRYLIVGGGLAAARAVEGIREVDPEGPITVVTAEPHLPYERPPLSKGVLLESDQVDAAVPHDADWYAGQHATVITGDAVTAIDPQVHTATLASDRQLAWDRLLLATGSSVRRLSVPGADLPGVHYLRTMDDSLALLDAIRAGGDVVIVGAGWIGLEVAAAARQHGCRVTVVDPQPAPLLAVMGERIGGWFADLHRSHGVALRLGVGLDRIEGEDAVRAVITSEGEALPADIVVVGIGIRPTTELAEAAGLEVDNGVVTDEHLRTSVPDIWAAGDVANWRSPLLGTHLRVEHWANANDSGFEAGRSMAGAEVTYDPVPFFFSDQYDAGLEYTGHVGRDASAEVVLRGDPSDGAFLAFWVEPAVGGVRVLAGMHVNTWDTIDAISALIRSGAVLDRARLADPQVPLAELG